MDRTKLNEINTVPVDTELDQELQKKDEAVEQEASEHFELKVDSRRDERILAFYLIYAMDRFDYTVPLENIVQNFQEGFSVVIPDHPFALTLAKNTIDARDQLDEKIKPYLKNWKLERLGCCTRLILRLALWELEQPGAISSIVINEAVELAKMFAEKDAYKFINGILDEMYQKSTSSEAGEEKVEETPDEESKKSNE